MTYALTNADGLNLGRHTGRYDAVAELLRMDGEWMVLMRMCKSARARQRSDKAVAYMRNVT